MREQTKPANKNYIHHSISAQAESGEENIALTSATEKTFISMDDGIKELSNEKLVWKIVNWI